MFYGISIPDFIDKDDEMYSEITSALNCLENTFNSIQRREKYVIQQWYSYASEVKVSEAHVTSQKFINFLSDAQKISGQRSQQSNYVIKMRQSVL